MTYGDLILAYFQRQEYLANLEFEKNPPMSIEELKFQDAYISEEERWEDLCQLQNSQQ
jgi:hypothetical protein